MAKLPGFFRAPHLRLLIISSLAINLLALALPIMTMQVYDRIMTNKAVDTLVVLSFGVVVAALMEFLLRSGRNKVISLVGAKFEHEASVIAVGKLLQAEPRDYEKTSRAMLMQNIGAAARLKDCYGGQMAAVMLVDIPFAILLLTLLFYLSPMIAGVCSVLLAGFAFFSWRHGTALKKRMDEREAEDNMRYNFIIQILHSIHTVKALCLEAVMARKFEEVQRDNGTINYRIAITQGAVGTLGYTTAQLMTIAVICAGAPMVVSGSITVGALIACVMLSGQVMQPLQRGLGLWVRMQDIEIARRRLEALLSLPERESISHDELGTNHGRVKFDSLRFAYREGKPVLDGASLSIEPGEIVSIQGATGAGKSSLIELLAGIYRPDRGSVTLSGMEAWKIPPSERAKFIAYLPSKGVILRGSIMDNLCGFDPKRQPEVMKIAELLGIDEAVALLPAGYDTPLEGLETDVIPPGLKQRIAMARALLSHPRFILYDNADHGLDRESYMKIFQLLARLKGRATIVLVSEDRNILSLADRSVELNGGRLVPIAEPAPLLANFRRMGA